MFRLIRRFFEHRRELAAFKSGDRFLAEYRSRKG